MSEHIRVDASIWNSLYRCVEGMDEIRFTPEAYALKIVLQFLHKIAPPLYMRVSFILDITNIRVSIPSHCTNVSYVGGYERARPFLISVYRVYFVWIDKILTEKVFSEVPTLHRKGPRFEYRQRRIGYWIWFLILLLISSRQIPRLCYNRFLPKLSSCFIYLWENYLSNPGKYYFDVVTKSEFMWALVFSRRWTSRLGHSGMWHSTVDTYRRFGRNLFIL
jgi:hypothetical protein